MDTKELTVVDSVDLDVVGVEPEGGELELVTEGTGAVERATLRRAAARWCQRGMVSAEWAVGIIAAVALAGVLIAVVTNGQVKAMLLKFVLEVIHSFSGYVR